MQPGEIFFERFGHNAIVVDDPRRRRADLLQLRLLRPRAKPASSAASCAATCATSSSRCRCEQDLAYYREVGRGVSIQWLDLDAGAGQRAGRARSRRTRARRTRATATTTSPTTAPRACAMRSTARSAARLRAQLTVRSQRQHLPQRSGAPGLARAVDVAGLRHRPGPYADRPLSRWEDAFVPMRLADEPARGEATPTAVRWSLAKPQLLPHRIAPEPPEAPRRWWPWLHRRPAAGDRPALAGDAQAARCSRAVALPFWPLCGVARPAAGLHLVLHRASSPAGRTRTCCCSRRCACCCCRARGRIAARARDRSRFRRWVRIAVGALAARGSPCFLPIARRSRSCQAAVARAAAAASTPALASPAAAAPRALAAHARAGMMRAMTTTLPSRLRHQLRGLRSPRQAPRHHAR